MSPLMRHKHSDYMHWSKTQSRARFNLATSGVGGFPLRELPVNLEKLEINGDNSYGYAPLQEAIALNHGVDPECVVQSAGTSRPSPHTTMLIPSAWWNPQAHPWQIIWPWLRSLNRAMRS